MSLSPPATLLCLQASSGVRGDTDFQAACWLGRSSEPHKFACAFLAFIFGVSCLQQLTGSRRQQSKLPSEGTAVSQCSSLPWAEDCTAVMRTWLLLTEFS